MTWTATPPDRPGLWGWRPDPNAEPVVRRVFRHHGNRLYVEIDGDVFRLGPAFAITGGEWWDEPLRLPWEESK